MLTSSKNFFFLFLSSVNIYKKQLITAFLSLPIFHLHHQMSLTPQLPSSKVLNMGTLMSHLLAFCLPFYLFLKYSLVVSGKFTVKYNLLPSHTLLPYL